MAKWWVALVVDGPKFEALMEMLVPLKVEGLEFKPVAGTPTRIRAGDRPGWQVVVEAATTKPQPVSHFVNAMTKAGFPLKSAYSAVDQAVRKRALHKVKVKGVNHYRVIKGGK